jgi:hypothetical protein
MNLRFGKGELDPNVSFGAEGVRQLSVAMTQSLSFNSSWALPRELPSTHMRQQRHSTRLRQSRRARPFVARWITHTLIGGLSLAANTASLCHCLPGGQRMILTRRRRRWGAPMLLLLLVTALGIFGAPVRYGAGLSVLLATAQIVAIAMAAGSLALPAWRSGDETRRRIAVVGLLLIMPWALLTLMPGYGPPFASTLSMNHVRFVILFVSTLLIGMGFLLMKDPLSDYGDKLLAPLGQATGLFAASIQLVWAAIMIGWTMSEAHKPGAYLPLYGTPLGNSADVLLFFAGLLTYVATGFYALSCARAGWIRPSIAVTMTLIAAAAVACLVVRGFQYPDLAGDWYTMPGMIVGIPAIPWLMPYVLGVVALLSSAEPLPREVSTAA